MQECENVERSEIPPMRGENAEMQEWENVGIPYTLYPIPNNV
jgi:hypothetical protein